MSNDWMSTGERKQQRLDRATMLDFAINVFILFVKASTVVIFVLKFTSDTRNKKRSVQHAVMEGVAGISNLTLRPQMMPTRASDAE